MKLLSVIVFALLLMSCTKDPKEVYTEAVKCMSSGDYKGAESNYRWLVAHNPPDISLQANLAFSLTEQGNNSEAIPMYQQIIKGGDGTYDLFAYYAKSLSADGQDEDAITWYYRALSVVPQLVDVRGSLAKILVKKGRQYEALSLLASFDEELVNKGDNPYF